MNEQAQFFPSRAGQPLYGVYCAAGSSARRSMAALLCYPIAEEFVMAYRAYTHLARALAAAGIPSLRFHYRGCGNSAGDALDVRLPGLVSDSCDAAALLMRNSECKRLILIGVRLGASIAALSAAELPGVDALVLHSPIVDGEAYWDSLLRAEQVHAFARGRRPTSGLESGQPPEGEDDPAIFGDRWSHEFVQQMAALDLKAFAHTVPKRILLANLQSDRVGTSHAEALATQWQAGGSNIGRFVDEGEAFWKPRAMQRGYFPEAFIQKAAAWAHELCNE